MKTVIGILLIIVGAIALGYPFPRKPKFTHYCQIVQNQNGIYKNCTSKTHPNYHVGVSGTVLEDWEETLDDPTSNSSRKIDVENPPFVEPIKSYGLEIGPQSTTGTTSYGWQQIKVESVKVDPPNSP